MESKIAAISYLLPDNILSNDDLAALSKNNDTANAIFRKTGIQSRRIMDKDFLPSDFAVLCFQKFLNEHPEVNKNDIDFLIYCGEGTDYRSPCTAGIIQHKAGLKQSVGGFDVGLSCSGYVYGLMIASSLIKSGACKNVLFIAQACPTTVLHPEDLELRALFGDASSCTLISASEKTGIGKFVSGMDGSGEHALRVVSSSINDPLDKDWFGQENNFCDLPYGRMEMNGIDIFNFSLRVIPSLVKETLEKNNLTADEIDFFVLHQANVLMLKALRRKLNIPEEKYIINMENTGNTVMASIPICLVDLMKSGKAKAGSKIFIAGFGSGFSWSATVITL